MKPQGIDDWLRRAYSPGPDCPPPQTYLEESLEGMSAADRASVLEHAERCPACAAERDLAGAFDEPPGDGDVHREDVDFIVERLRNRARERRVVVPIASARSGKGVRVTARWAMAAAAMFAVVALATFTMLRAPAPSLPTRTDDPVMRGQRLEVESPVGALESMPAALRWEAVPEAATYRVRVLGVDETVLWEYTVSDPLAELPADLLATMHPAVTYFWQVDALDSEGSSVAGSGRVEFRVNPSGGED